MMDEIKPILDYLTSAAGIREVFGYFVLFLATGVFFYAMYALSMSMEEKPKHEHKHKS